MKKRCIVVTVLSVILLSVPLLVYASTSAVFFTFTGHTERETHLLCKEVYTDLAREMILQRFIETISKDENIVEGETFILQFTILEIDKSEEEIDSPFRDGEKYLKEKTSIEVYFMLREKRYLPSEEPFLIVLDESIWRSERSVVRRSDVSSSILPEKVIDSLVEDYLNYLKALVL